MTRPHVSLILIAAALVAGVALAGCKRHAEPANESTVPPAATTAPMPATASPPASTTAASPMATTPPPATSPIVSGVDLGSAVGGDNKVTKPSTSFAKTDTIHASVATNGSKASTVTARWTFQDGQVVHSEDKSIAAGAQVTDFSISKPDGWPAGDYKLEVLVDGNVAQTKDFKVK
ncbi:MAG: hypothetical protein HOQ02_06180 [Lysobacter sp.]|nr:hypothetical protein [Lysobacter sp.]